MKNLRTLFYFLIVLTAFCSCGRKKQPLEIQTAKNDSIVKSKDNLCVFQKLNLMIDSKLFQHVDDIENTFLFGDTLYLCSLRAKAVFVVNLKNLSVSEPSKLNQTIDSLGKSYGRPTDLNVDANNIFIVFEKALVAFDKRCRFKYAIKTSAVAGRIATFPGDKLAVMVRDSVFTYNKANGIFERAFKEDIMYMSYIKSNDGIVYGQDHDLTKLALTLDSISIVTDSIPKKIEGIGKTETGYCAYATRDKFLWFEFGKRDKMMVLDKKFNKIIKTISLGKFDLSTENEFELSINEYYIDFSLEVHVDNFYISRFKDHSLSIYKGCL